MTQYTDDLKQQVEHTLPWGHSSHWRSGDFEQLSERIHAYTYERIDAQDLQAFWKNSFVASSVLLDTLARFIDYADWEDFRARNRYGIVETDEETNRLHAPVWEIPIRWVVIICWFSVIAAVAVGILLACKR